MSLSDELLADFEEEGMNVDGSERTAGLATINEEMETDQNATLEEQSGSKNSVKSVAKLYNSKRLKDVMSNISKFSKVQRGPVSGPVESDPEYQVIVEANEITVEITDELGGCQYQMHCLTTCYV